MTPCLNCGSAATATDPIVDQETAQTEHLEWLGRVMAALQDGYPSADLLCETTRMTCVFGRWLTKHARVEGVAADKVAQLSDCHDTMHAMATELLLNPRRDSDYFTDLDAFCRKAVAFNRLLTTIEPSPRSSAEPRAANSALHA